MSDNVIYIFSRIADTTYEEFSLFKGLTHNTFTANLVNVKNAIKEYVFAAYLQNLNGTTTEEGGVVAKANLKGMGTPGIDIPEVLEEFNKNKLETLYVLQSSRESMEESVLNDILRLKKSYF